MPAIKLRPDPTFTARVPIPVPGKDAVEVEFTFKHQDRDEFMAFLKAAEKMTDLTHIMTICAGWELEEEFNKKNVGLLLQNYGGASRAIASTYIRELTGGSEAP